MERVIKPASKRKWDAIPNRNRPYDHVPDIAWGTLKNMKEKCKCGSLDHGMVKGPYGGYTWVRICETCDHMIGKVANQSRGKTKREDSPATDTDNKDSDNVSTPAGNDAINQAMGALMAALENSKAPKFDRDDVVAVVREILEQESRPLVIKLEGMEVPTFDGLAHQAVKEVLLLISRGFTNIFLYGPPGTGKTTIAAQVAEALKRPMADVSMSAGVTEMHWTGRTVPNITDGSTRFVETNFTAIVENPSVYLVDEADHGDPSSMAKLNMFLANDRITTADNRTLKRHAECIVLCGANTSGRGGDRQHTAAQPLPASFLDRFAGAFVRVDYDHKLEHALAVAWSGGNKDKGERICTAVWNLRKKADEKKLKGRYLGTRSIIGVAKHVAGGEGVGDAVARLTVDWSEEERRSVGL